MVPNQAPLQETAACRPFKELYVGRIYACGSGSGDDSDEAGVLEYTAIQLGLPPEDAHSQAGRSQEVRHFSERNVMRSEKCPFVAEVTDLK